MTHIGPDRASRVKAVTFGTFHRPRIAMTRATFVTFRANRAP